MECYYTYTRKNVLTQSGCHEYFFFKDDGCKLDAITEIIRSMGRIVPVHPTKSKEVITSKGVNNDHLQLMQRHMTHSASNSKRHYLYTDMENYTEGPKEIEKITLKKS